MIYMAEHVSILNNNQNTYHLRFTFKTKPVRTPLKQKLRFYCISARNVRLVSSLSLRSQVSYACANAPLCDVNHEVECFVPRCASKPLGLETKNGTRDVNDHSNMQWYRFPTALTAGIFTDSLCKVPKQHNTLRSQEYELERDSDMKIRIIEVR